MDRVTYLSRNNVQRLIDEGAGEGQRQTDQGELTAPRPGTRSRWSRCRAGQQSVPESIHRPFGYEKMNICSARQAGRFDRLFLPGGDGPALFVNGLVYYGEKWRPSTELVAGHPSRFDRNIMG